jgi:hypothetical protein
VKDERDLSVLHVTYQLPLPRPKKSNSGKKKLRGVQKATEEIHALRHCCSSSFIFKEYFPSFERRDSLIFSFNMGKKSKSQSEKAPKIEKAETSLPFLAGNASIDPTLASLFETSVRESALSVR